MNTIGELTLGEFRALNDIKARMSQLTQEIGQLEVRKSLLLREMQALSDQSEKVVQSAVTRLGFEDKTITIREDGSIVEVSHG